MSTFRLYGPNISNRHLTETEVSARRLLCADTNVRITSHDWHVQPFVKDQLAFRLSGAPSVRPILPEGETERPRNSSKLSRSEKHCQPAEITGFPPDFNSSGSLNPDMECNDLLLESSLAAYCACLLRLFTAPETLSRRSGRFLAHAKAEDSRKLKIAWRLCSTRKPFRERCPRMRTPERGQLEAY